MREILDRDPEAVNANNLQGWNSLMYAAANDYPEIVQEVRLFNLIYWESNIIIILFPVFNLFSNVD